MKYCKICKTVGKDDETHCAKGHVLSEFASKGGGSSTTTSSGGSQKGASSQTGNPAGRSSPPPAPKSPPHPVTPNPTAQTVKPPPRMTPPSNAAETPASRTFGLPGEIRKLEEAKKRNVRLSQTFGIASIVFAVGILLFLYVVYSQTVLAYAVLEDIRMTRKNENTNMVDFEFKVVRPGKIVIDWKSGKYHSEFVAIHEKPGETAFFWGMPAERKAGIDIGVLYRGGWLRSSKHEHFSFPSLR